MGRKKEKVEVQTSLNEGFKVLVTELQEEREALIARVRLLNEEVDVLRGDLRQAEAKNASLERLLAMAALRHDPAPPALDQQEDSD